MNTIEQALHKLQYSPLWLVYGLLDEAYLLEQSAQFDASDDKNTEHYRYAAFRAFLASYSSLPNDYIDKYVHLAQIDPVPLMGQAALMDLIGWRYLTDAQLDRLDEHLSASSPNLRRSIERLRLRRLLQPTTLTNELFQRALISRDDVTQRELINSYDISREQLETLRDQGANKAIRNMAKQKLATHRYAD